MVQGIAHVSSERLANPVMQLTNSGAAQGVLRPPCLLALFAAEQRVGRVRKRESARSIHQGDTGAPS